MNEVRSAIPALWRDGMGPGIARLDEPLGTVRGKGYRKGTHKFARSTFEHTVVSWRARNRFRGSSPCNIGKLTIMDH